MKIPVVTNNRYEHFEQDERYIFCQSDGHISSPIVKWNGISLGFHFINVAVPHRIENVAFLSHEIETSSIYKEKRNSASEDRNRQS